MINAPLELLCCFLGCTKEGRTDGGEVVNTTLIEWIPAESGRSSGATRAALRGWIWEGGGGYWGLGSWEGAVRTED